MGHLEVVLKGFHSHDALVFVASEAHAGIERQVIVAEAADQVVMGGIHF